MKFKTPVLEIDGLDFRRNRNFLLSIDGLAVKAGEVVCVVGANGSGKTTLMETAVGLLSPAGCTVMIHGKKLQLDAPDAKKLIGFIPDDDNWIIGELTAREYFKLLKTIYREAGVTADMDENIVKFSRQLLFTQYDQQLHSLSHGNKRKVQIISALMHEPSLIIVDELRNGLDPISIHRAEALVKQRAIDGMAVFASTHDLWWAERFAKKIIMLKHGQILLQQSTVQIVTSAGSLENKFMEMYDAGF